MLLSAISNPEDLKKLKISQLPELCQDLREHMLSVISQTGGHLASGLGAVEMIVALHYVFDAPRDHILWDVGHQAYPHKILTGRRDNFSTVKQFGGISGYPTRGESPYDIFTTGHASSALSLALGMAAARDLCQGKEKVVAVLGDASLTGGLCFEGLNNAGHLKKDLLVVLNSNDMSIAPNVGSLSKYLNKIISQPIYNRVKIATREFVTTRAPRLGPRLTKVADRFEEFVKGLIVPGIFFEEMGFRYFGPLDGHQIEPLIETLKNISLLKGPILLHVITKKGKGYAPAEKDPVFFHGPTPFDLATGQPQKTKSDDSKIGYTKAFAESLIKLAEQDKHVVAITAAMPGGTGLDKFAARFPDRCFDVGIAEGHAVCFASGLAARGLKPVVAIYSTFLQRAYDQIIADVCLQQIPVTFVLDRAGVVGPDGMSHQGEFDISYLRNIPHLVVMAPKDAVELDRMLKFSLECNKPAAIRFPKEDVPVTTGLPQEDVVLGCPEVVLEGRDILILAFGSMVLPSVAAAQALLQENISVKVVNARFAKPLCQEAFLSQMKGFRKVITVEEGVLEGGFGSAILELWHGASDKTEGVEIRNLHLPLEFIKHGERKIFLKMYGLDAEGIARTARGMLHAEALSPKFSPAI